MDTSWRREKSLTHGLIMSVTPRCGVRPLVSWASEVSEAKWAFGLQRGGGSKPKRVRREERKLLFFYFKIIF